MIRYCGIKAPLKSHDSEFSLSHRDTEKGAIEFNSTEEQLVQGLLGNKICKLWLKHNMLHNSYNVQLTHKNIFKILGVVNMGVVGGVIFSWVFVA